MARIYNVMGVSGAGKDTVAGILSELLPKTKMIKWVQPTKDAIEAAYGLPVGTLNDREARQQPIDPSRWGSFSYLDLLVEMAKVKMNSSLTFGRDETVQDIKLALLDGYDVVLTDTRMPSEVEEVMELSQQYPVHNICVFGRGNALCSDTQLNENWRRLVTGILLQPCTFTCLPNTMNLEHLKSRVRGILEATGVIEAP